MRKLIAVAVLMLGASLLVKAQSDNTQTIALGRTSCSIGILPTCSWPGTGIKIDDPNHLLDLLGASPHIPDGNYKIPGMTFTFADGSIAVGHINLITASHPATLTIPSTELVSNGINYGSVVGQVTFDAHSCSRTGCAAITASNPTNGDPLVSFVIFTFVQ